MFNIRHTTFENNKVKNVELIEIPSSVRRAYDDDSCHAFFAGFVLGLQSSDWVPEGSGYEVAGFSIEGTDQLELFELLTGFGPLESLQYESSGIWIESRGSNGDVISVPRFIAYKDTASGPVVDMDRIAGFPDSDERNFVFGRVDRTEMSDTDMCWVFVEPCHISEADICLHKSQLCSPDEFAKFLAANNDTSMIESEIRRSAMDVPTQLLLFSN